MNNALLCLIQHRPMQEIVSIPIYDKFRSFENSTPAQFSTSINAVRVYHGS